MNDAGVAQNASLFTCSVDARWTYGTNIGTALPNTDNMVVSSSIAKSRKPTTRWTSSKLAFLPTQGPDWRTVGMDQEWLEALVPPVGLNASNGWTTLAKTFTDAGFDNSTGTVHGSWASLGSTIESTIATTIVEGMSRVGLSKYPPMTQVFERDDFLTFDNGPGDTYPFPHSDSTRPWEWDRLLQGTHDYVLPPNGSSKDDIIKLQWSVTVSGLAYSADSTAYYLALSLLFAHALLAALQILSMLITCRSSDA